MQRDKMKVTFDQDAIQIMNLFQNLTGSSVIDCVSDDDELYFVIAEGKYGFTVGKGGAKIKNAERVFKKMINVIEYSPTLEGFIKNIIPYAQEIEIKDKKVFVKVKPTDRPRIIGKGGKNIRIINKFLQRLFDVEELKVK
jgi:N utilization substance protein A